MSRCILWSINEFWWCGHSHTNCVDRRRIKYTNSGNWTNDNDTNDNDTNATMSDLTHIWTYGNRKKKNNRYLCKMLNHVDRAPLAAIPTSCRQFGHLYRSHSYHLNEIPDFPLFKMIFLCLLAVVVNNRQCVCWVCVFFITKKLIY